MGRSLSILLVACLRLCADPLPPLVCPSGGPVGSVDLRVISSHGAQPLPLRTINHLEEGDTITYRPLLRSGEERKGEVAIVLVPANKTDIVILDPKDAGKPQKWEVPLRVSVVAYVYGPSGLDAKKVKTYLSRDNELVGQLADYADKTAQTEALISTLLSPASSADAVQSALGGFASTYGMNVQLDRTAPNSQQALTLFRTMNPALAAYDPVSPQAAPASGQTASLATGIAAMFYGTPVGLAAGGTAMLMELRSIAFPRSEFRSSFSQPLPEDGMGLCGRRDPALPHTKLAYIWASRVPNIGAPQLSLGKANGVPAGMKSTIAIESTAIDWQFADRARGWALQRDFGKPIPIRILKLGLVKQFEIELDSSVRPGKYNLLADWDWDHFRVAGELEVAALSDFTSARVAASSQEALVAKNGKVPVTLEGSNFEFVTKVEIEKLNDEFATPSGVPFVLPRGPRQGDQERMDIQVNTGDLDPGSYKLLLTQVDNQTHPIKLNILPAPPHIENFPVTLNQGEKTIDYQLKGERLDLLKRMELERGEADLGPPSGTSERHVTVHVPQDLPSGSRLTAKVYMADRTAPVTLDNAVRVVGARPRIEEVKIAQAPGVDVQLADGELAGESKMSAMLRVARLTPASKIKLICAEGGTAPVEPGWQQVSPDQAFLSFDTGAWPNHCGLRAIVENAGEGESEAYPIGRVVRVPAIERLENSNLVGKHLETIEMTGWTPADPQPVPGLPIPGQGQEQVLAINSTPPDDSDALLYVWLRGEARPRATRIRP